MGWGGIHFGRSGSAGSSLVARIHSDRGLLAYREVIRRLGIVGEEANQIRNLQIVVASLLDHADIAVRLKPGDREILRDFTSGQGIVTLDHDPWIRALSRLVVLKEAMERKWQGRVIIGSPSADWTGLARPQVPVAPMPPEAIGDWIEKRLREVSGYSQATLETVKKMGPKMVLSLIFRDPGVVDALLRISETSAAEIVGTLRRLWGEETDPRAEEEFRELRERIKTPRHGTLKRKMSVTEAGVREIRINMTDVPITSGFLVGNKPRDEMLSLAGQLAFYLSRQMVRLDRYGAMAVEGRFANQRVFEEFAEELKAEFEAVHLGLFFQGRSVVLQWHRRGEQRRIFLQEVLKIQREEIGRITTEVLIGKIEEELNLLESIIDRMEEDPPERLWETVYMLHGRLENGFKSVADDKRSDLFREIEVWFVVFQGFLQEVGRRRMSRKEAREGFHDLRRVFEFLAA